jgi:hypothetical protein
MPGCTGSGDVGRLSKQVLRDDFGITDERVVAAWSDQEWFPGESVRREPTDAVLQRRADRAELMRRIVEARCRFRRRV